jgi:hypothetical protein
MTDAYEEHVKRLHAKDRTEPAIVDEPGRYIHPSGVAVIFIRESQPDQFDGFASDKTTARMNAAMAEMANPTPPAKRR